MSPKFPHVCELHFEVAREFVDSISPRGPRFGDVPLPDNWLFRGLPHDDYVLIPSALRETDSATLHQIADTPKFLFDRSEFTIAQEYAEVQVLSLLLEELNRQGLPLPIDATLFYAAANEVMRAAAKTPDPPVISEWLSDGIWPLIGLAQHYGLPTRLLDWSWSAFVAAYFAADPVKIVAGNASGNAVVWALHIRVRELRPKDGVSFNPIGLLTVPRATNPNLHAQHGLFSVQRRTVIECKQPVSRVPLNKCVEELESNCFAHPIMFRFTFPRTIAGEVLWLLAKEGVTAAQLFPGHRGAVEAIKERVAWKKPPSGAQAGVTDT